MAAGIAGDHGGQLDRLIRVWTLGTGVGYGQISLARRHLGSGAFGCDARSQRAFLRDAAARGIWKESWANAPCGCALWTRAHGKPEEIFQEAASGDTRCVDFVKLWHRALAAGTATSIHLDGPGKFL